MAKDYGTTWETCHLITLGGNWAFAVGIVEDSRGTKKVRIAKGRLKENDREEPGDCPISQVNKLNLKVKDWARVRALIDDAIKELVEIEGEEVDP